MRDCMKYINHIGDIVEFGKGNILINESDLRDFEWTYSTKCNKVTNFEKNISQKTLPVIIAGNGCTDTANALFDKLEKDILSGKPGRVYIGDFYLEGYFYASKKSGYTKQNSIYFELKFVTNQDTWIRETTERYFASGNNQESDDAESGILDYPYDYPTDYSSGSERKNLINSSYSDADFEMTIYGSCQNPEIVIGGHKYSVSCQLETGEYLKINSVSKKVYQVEVNGDIVNQFHLRGRDYYIFQKIPSGNNTVTWNGLFGFDITLMEKRSEPKWI